MGKRYTNEERREALKLADEIGPAAVAGGWCKNRHPSPICTRFEPHFHALKLHLRCLSFKLPRSRSARLHTPPQEYSMTAEGGALVPREWCIHSGEMVHGGRRRGAPSRHAGAYSGRALRLRMDSPSIWIVYAL